MEQERLLNVALFGDQHSGKSLLIDAFFRWKHPERKVFIAPAGKRAEAGTKELGVYHVGKERGHSVWFLDTKGMHVEETLPRTEPIMAGLKSGTDLEYDYDNQDFSDPLNAGHHAIVVIDSQDIQSETVTEKTVFFFFTSPVRTWEIDLKKVNANKPLIDKLSKRLGTFVSIIVMRCSLLT